MTFAYAFCLHASAATPVPAAADNRPAPTPAAVAPADFSTFAERYGPAVVNVTARVASEQVSPPEQEAIDSSDPFFAFFRRDARPSPDAQAGAPSVMTGRGSGFIISPDGLILTTAHVVDSAAEVTVRLTDQREFKAQVVAVDPQSDVAVLQIDAHKLPAVKLGDSSRVRVGEPVLSIGSPDGFQNTVTTGIISATTRILPNGSAFPFFQTEIAANPDNSGGPLFNRAGEVIGIDVQVYTDSDRYESLTFGIPIKAANQVREQVQSQREPAPGTAGNGGKPAGANSFGMQVEDVSPGLAVALGLPHAAGALVDTVEAGSPAAAAGLKAGDVILQVGDKRIEQSAALADQLAAVPPGTRTTLKLIRSRRLTTASFPGETTNDGAAATAAAAAADVAPVAAAHVTAVPPDSGAADRLGLVTHPLSEDERRKSGLPLGLMVDASSGPAANAGIKVGDIVVSLDDTLVESQDQAAALEAKAKKMVAVLIQRDNARNFVSVKVK
ncbi:trypsin-like peptidase domain-containing protein [Paraburkholderia sp. MMS20-SJTN17]|uniref:Probable periplasmic serine endoprotease DegP-like n=1 Tax=Paraburkholderia translucens TaxID=2886945 RepID=A0ABS8KDR6_9BURK|nr:trypsin-like peptidase domain-containing protein [Paraburkholderia sp. MMS20-SJTN17]MCC8402900.1 trypsin-like peptidase domain-containing protein [Paraburkholderia sp. MMS20-SJTN17]